MHVNVGALRGQSCWSPGTWSDSRLQPCDMDMLKLNLGPLEEQ